VTVKHVVWMKFKVAVTPARMSEHVRALQGLTTRVPGILDLSVGANFTDRANGFTHGLVVTLEDRAALERYSAHPAHVEVAAALRLDADLQALDYEC
jgi:hypothetical protein